MTYGYSDDLREKALKYYDASRRSQSEVSEVFGVHLRTFAEWVKLRKRGDYRRRPQQKKRAPLKIDSAALKAYIEAHPDAYFREIAVVFKVSDVGILKACRRLGITRKKNAALRRTRRSGTRHVQRRSRADSA
ncbi:MAG: DNA-binding protein [Pseudomonadota bacterium]|nr:DNA-binding protein [Pseudomonadota bacterium]